MTNFHRFEHINQACRNLESTRQFYQALFPDWYVRAEGESSELRWMHFGNDQFYLALHEAIAGAAIADQPPSEPEACHIQHVGFVIEDGEQMRSLLEAHAIPYTTYNSPETKLRLYVNDPDGTEIELVQYQTSYALR